MPNHATLLDAATAAVAEACTVCRAVQKALEKVKAITKDDNSPVTVADYASQAVIAHRLRAALGDIVLVGEESSATLRQDSHTPHREAALAAVREVWPGASEKDMLDAIDAGAADTNHQAFWTLDPVDGTKGFLRGQQYAIALAYIERGIPVVGILGCPNLPRDFSLPLDQADEHGSIYRAILGEGVDELPAAAIPGEPRPAPLHIKRLDHAEGEPITVCESVESGHSKQDDTARVLDLLGQRGEPVRIDSQCKYAVVGRGQADAYLRLPTRKSYVERIWDHAAGSLVATEAGCFVTDIHGRALDFTHGRGLEQNKGIVCAPPRIHGLLIGAIEKLGIGR